PRRQPCRRAQAHRAARDLRLPAGEAGRPVRAGHPCRTGAVLARRRTDPAHRRGRRRRTAAARGPATPPAGRALPGGAAGVPHRARRHQLPRLPVAARARPAQPRPHRRLRAASGRGGGAEAGVRRRSARGRPCARRLRRGAGPAATARPRGADPSRPGTGRPALRGAAGRVRHRGGRRPRRTGALAAGLLGDLVSDQAPACAAPVPAPDPGPSGEVGAGRRAAGAARRLTAPHERQRHAAAQSALATGRAPGFGTAPAGRPARRAGGVVAAGLAATPAIEGLQAADEGILYICCATIAYMPARERLPPWHERQRLPNGREVLIRPIRPEDADPLRASFSLLQPEEVRQRFLQSMKSLPEDMLERLTRVNPKTEFALVAAEPLPPGEALVGAVARVTADPEGEQGEFAILVSHYVAGQGLGRYLMTRLVKWARGKKLRRIYGDVLENNQPMLSLADSLGFQRKSMAGGLVRVELDLAPGGDADAAGEQRM